MWTTTSKRLKLRTLVLTYVIYKFNIILWKHLFLIYAYVNIIMGDKMKITHGRGYVYSIQYHIVWCVKYRYPVLTDEIEKRVVEILYKRFEDNNF